MKTVTVKFNKVNFPFYKTMRGTFDFNSSGYTADQMAAGRVDAMLAFIYYQLRDCAKRDGIKFPYSFDEFIDLADDDILEVFAKLNTKEAAPGEVPQEAPQKT